MGGGITGYTNAIIFSQLDFGTFDPIQLRERLKLVTPSGVTPADVDALFSNYGF